MLDPDIKHRLSQEMAEERQAQRLPVRCNRLLATLNALVQALGHRLLDKAMAG